MTEEETDDVYDRFSTALGRVMTEVFGAWIDGGNPTYRSFARSFESELRKEGLLVVPEERWEEHKEEDHDNN